MVGRGSLWLVLGLLLGGVAGAALRLLLDSNTNSRRAVSPAPVVGGGAADRMRGLAGRAGAAFARGRTSVLEYGHATSEAAGAGTATTPAAPLPAIGATGITGSVQGLTGSLKARWREALAEGRQAAAEKEAELRHRYAELTQRITEGR
jgi:hypothetical protein